MELIAGILLLTLIGLGSLLPGLLLLSIPLGGWLIDRARKQAEGHLAGSKLLTPKELRETMNWLSRSRNSYNKALLAKLMEHL